MEEQKEKFVTDDTVVNDMFFAHQVQHMNSLIQHMNSLILSWFGLTAAEFFAFAL